MKISPPVVVAVGVNSLAVVVVTVVVELLGVVGVNVINRHLSD